MKAILISKRKQCINFQLVCCHGALKLDIRLVYGPTPFWYTVGTRLVYSPIPVLVYGWYTVVLLWYTPFTSLLRLGIRSNSCLVYGRYTVVYDPIAVLVYGRCTAGIRWYMGRLFAVPYFYIKIVYLKRMTRSKKQCKSWIYFSGSSSPKSCKQRLCSFWKWLGIKTSLIEVTFSSFETSGWSYHIRYI